MSPASEHQLDDPQTYARLDPDGMGTLIAELGDQVREALPEVLAYARAAGVEVIDG